MALPTRTQASLDRVKRLPMFAVLDSSDTNPVFISLDGNNVPCAIGLNYTAMLDANGKINLDNFLATAAIAQANITPATDNTKNVMRMGKWTYSFAVNGGGTGTIAMTGETLPVNAVVIGGVMDVTTAVTGSGATVAVQLQAANDIISAAAVSGAPWSTTGLKAIVPVFTNATYKKVATTAKTPSLVVTSAALDGGVVNLHLLYVLSDA